jgi:hypothetical protein
MLAGLSHRRHYRRALGVDENRRLIVVTSTWGPHSLLGMHEDLLPRLIAELPQDEYAVAAALHPNIWHGHGPWQVRTWLAACRRSGLVLLPPRDGWRAALIGADAVIGDHGSVTFYGAALGRPTLLGAFPHDDVDPASPVADLGRAAPALRFDRPLREQIDAVIAGHRPDRYAAITSKTTSAPGRSAKLIRDELYRLMELERPPGDPAVERVPEPAVADATRPAAMLVSATWRDRLVVVRRYPAAVGLTWRTDADEMHLAVAETETDDRLLQLADIVYCRHARLRTAASTWLDEALAHYPGCFLAAVEEVPGELSVKARDGAVIRCAAADPALAASAIYSWLAAGREVALLPRTCAVQTGSTRRWMTFMPEPRGD